MTDLVEKINIRITKNHEKAKHSIYHYDKDVINWDELEDIWEALFVVVTSRGQGSLNKGALEIHWTNLGLEEDAGEGDN
jgi:hypothetical protein